MTLIDDYRTYLANRNGRADLLDRRLERREEFFDQLRHEPIHSVRHFDGDQFTRNLRRRKPEPSISQEMAWLLATAKLNQAERFGVGLGETYARNAGVDAPPESVYLELEEHYHTRLLAHVLDIFGLPFQAVPPPFVMRQFVKVSVFMPERFGVPYVGAAEMAGCLMFDTLRRIGCELFADEPSVAERIDLLYTEILTDEIGHVSYCSMRSSPRGRALMRRLYPWFGQVFAHQTAEISFLVGRAALRRRLAQPFDLARLAEGVDRPTFVAAVA